MNQAKTYPPLKGASLVLVTLALSLAVFMEVLDTTIANVVVPVIAGDLGAAATQGTWVITAFAVANAVSVPLTGFVARRFGEVKVFLGAVIGFVITSWLCGLAPNLQMLVLFRVLQGLVAGPLIPLSQSLLMASYPLEKRTQALALWAMTVVVAPVLGPILGGWISDNWHWGWIFFINIPVGIAAAWITWKQLGHRETEIKKTPIDYTGLVLMVLGVGALQMMLDRGKELDWFASGEIIALAVVAVVCLTYFVVWELGEEHPVVDLSLFKDRNFTVGVITTSLGFMVYMGSLVLLPLVLQSNLGYTATWAGLVAAPVGILPIILSPVIGKFGGRLDMRWLVTASFLVFAFTFHWRTNFYAGMDMANVVWPQFWQGLGVAMFFLPLTAVTLSRMQGAQVAAASSLSNFLRVFMGGVGVSVVTTMWERREALHHARLAEAVTPYSAATQQAVQNMVQAGIRPEEGLANIVKNITQQGFIIGSNEIFWAGSLLFIVMIAVIWFAKPPFGSSGGGGH
ncbi:MFS transporter [Neisseria dentiae]|uniref:MFS transporter n=1 Tax=Neisseria dentiae TaxID=194197 RepID=A0A1X3D4Z7_9NEIS|nr:DHA2 family efflux MFS transporter permease subunit [Neisseria dentiae]OSI14990.1 MFS transporter [Neisseria dentiae]QMT44770.1 DHA2 family efflux MFS transporter permease subunit [Neisseria dentiae]STZ50493.1 multidrug resistance translocase [Neisseria dentiae]